MANQITGRLVAISQAETIASKKEQGKTFQRRKVMMDCTRFDPYTGERGFENTPVLEFGGKALDQLNELERQGLKKGDVITVSFDVQGINYKDTQGKTQNFTSVRPYAVEKRVIKGDTQQVQQPAPAPAPTSAPTQGNDSELPF